jgi:hypothetical protein
MGGKIVFGSILSAVMLITVAFVAPVNVNATELNTAEKIKEKIEELGFRLENDETIIQLIDLHSTQEVEDIFTQVLNAETDDEIRSLANQYVELLGKEELNSIFNLINQKYGSGMNLIISSLQKLFGDREGNSNIYRIEQTNNKLKVTELDEVELKENTLIFKGDGELILPNGAGVTQVDWDKLADFCFQLSQLGLAVEIAGLIIEYIGIILTLLGFEELGYFLVNAGFAIGMTGFVIAMLFLILSEFFRKLAEEDGARNINYKPTFLENIRYRFLILLQRFIYRLTC